MVYYSDITVDAQGAPIRQSPSISTSPKKLPGTFDLLKEAWVIYKTRFGTFMGILLLLPVAVVSALILSVILALFLARFGLEGLLLGVVSFVAIFIFVQLWVQIALIYAIRGYVEKVGVKESYRRARHFIGPYGLLTILLGSVFFGGPIVYSIRGAGLAFPGLVILLVIPGAILGVSFSFICFMLASKRIRGLYALAKSREYVRGYWLAVFGRVLLGILIIAIAPNFIPVIGSLVAVALAPLLLVYSLLIYEHLKQMKAGDALVVTPSARKGLLALGALGVLVAVIVASLFLFAAYFLGYSPNGFRWDNFPANFNAESIYPVRSLPSRAGLLSSNEETFLSGSNGVYKDSLVPFERK